MTLQGTVSRKPTVADEQRNEARFDESAFVGLLIPPVILVAPTIAVGLDASQTLAHAEHRDRDFIRIASLSHLTLPESTDVDTERRTGPHGMREPVPRG